MIDEDDISPSFDWEYDDTTSPIKDVCDVEDIWSQQLSLPSKLLKIALPQRTKNNEKPFVESPPVEP